MADIDHQKQHPDPNPTRPSQAEGERETTDRPPEKKNVPAEKK